MSEPTIREQMDEVLWRKMTPAEILTAMGDTYRDSLPLRTHILLSQATKLLQAQADQIETVRQETAATIVARVRANCTPHGDAYLKGGDILIAAVADWIENPPAWVDAPWRVVKEPQVSEPVVPE